MVNLSVAEAPPLKRAVSAYQAGQLVEAEQLCEQIIAAKPDFFDALYLLALVQSQRGKMDVALATYDRALQLRPDSAELHFNRGNILEALKRHNEALASYDRAIQSRPDLARAHLKRGNILNQLNQRDEALANYDHALALRPDFALAHYERGNVLLSLKRFEEAIASYERALALQPRYAGALSNRGNALQELNRFEEALASYDSALALRPDFALVYFNRGNVLQALKRYDEALASYDRGLALQPDLAEAHSNRGNALQALNRYDEALASYDRALALRPDFAEALCNLGAALQALKRYDEALASYDRALAIRPDYADALSNRGLVLRQLMRFDEALASFEGAIAVSPDYAEAHFGEAEVRLLLGDFGRGWEDYEWRSKAAYLRNSTRSFTQPLWLGQSEIAGKTILIHAEQGFGDTVQFCRYVPLLAERGARVILQVREPLRELMNGLAGTTQVLSMGSALPDFDLQCPLLSLPLAFKTRLATIPSAVPYLRAAAQKVTEWEARLGPKHRPRIGLAWSGRTETREQSYRSISLSALLPLLDIEATFVSLQKAVLPQDAPVLNARSDILHFGDEIMDFSDTAALISHLDLVISIDTAVAHLAGALAKPVWVMLLFTPDWRWLLDRADSPWYPTARLFRQDDTQAWDNVIARVHTALRDLARPG
jgi:tetratricopeptide (TPR) repeat protein